jgi:phosphohistidine phosphatase
MRRLILFRHAKAEARAAGAGDAERPLEAGGRVDAAAAGRWLVAEGFAADVVLVSPALRTRQTWACVAELFPAARLVIEDTLYDAMPEDILAAVDTEAPGAETLMVIGHNPGLQELAITLLSESAAASRDADLISVGFPTATLAVLDMRDPGGAHLEGLFNPRHAPPPFVETWDEHEGDAP